MKKFILIILLFSSNEAKTQPNIDSLHAVWADESQSDSSRTFAYISYIWSGVLRKNPDSAFILADSLIEYGQENDYPTAKAYAFHIQAYTLFLKGNYDQSLEYNERSLKIKKEIGDNRGIAWSYNSIGNIYATKANNLKALEYFQKSLIIFKKINNQTGVSNALNNIGNTFLNQSNYTKSIEYYKRSLKIAEEIGEKSSVKNALGNIGEVYYYAQNYAQALVYCKRSIIISKEIEDKGGIAQALAIMGLIHLKTGNYKQALSDHKRSLDIANEIEDKKGIAFALNCMGKSYKSQGKIDLASNYFQQSLEISEDIKYKVGTVETLNDLGNLYGSQKMHNKSIEYCKKALILAEEINKISQSKIACECLYNAYRALGNGNKALAYLEQVRIKEDSLDSKETAEKLQQMEFEKEVLMDSIAMIEKERLAEAAHQKEIWLKNQTRNWVVAGGFLALLLAGGFYTRWRYVRNAKAVIEKEKGRSDNLLLNILPVDIAEELKEKGQAEAREFDKASILFTDFKGFTAASEKLSAKELVEEINNCFKAFDNICEKYSIEKIKTIGDSYMAAGGLPVSADESVKNTVLAALDMQAFIQKRKSEKAEDGQLAFNMRAGINTGPVVAGIVGVKKFQYDIWGDTVNTASRMESHGEVGQVNITQSTYEFIKDDPDFVFESRGKIQAKGKGEVQMFFVKLA